MNKQSGISLIETMIALLIGLFLLSGVLQLFSSAQQTYRMQSNLARLQENSRFALDFLTHDIRMAGYWGCMTSSTVDVSGTDGAQGASGMADMPDSITVQGAFVQALAGPCGSPVTIDPSSIITYQINTQSSNSSLPNPEITLYRSSNPLIEGIENMQILYGIDFNTDGVPDYYVPANPTWLTNDWVKVISVRISLLVVTLDDYLTTQPMTYAYNGQLWISPDHKIRRVFNTTIALRNRLPPL
jgi:type IV pilus assembly protein PilW